MRCRKVPVEVDAVSLKVGAVTLEVDAATKTSYALTLTVLLYEYTTPHILAPGARCPYDSGTKTICPIGGISMRHDAAAILAPFYDVTRTNVGITASPYHVPTGGFGDRSGRATNDRHVDGNRSKTYHLPGIREKGFSTPLQLCMKRMAVSMYRLIRFDWLRGRVGDSAR